MNNRTCQGSGNADTRVAAYRTIQPGTASGKMNIHDND